MQRFTVMQPVTFKTGRFRLSDAQLARRKYVVRVDESGIAQPIAEISFKAGEIIETDIDVPKALHGKLAPLTDAPAEVQFSVQEPVEAPAPRGKRGR